MPTLQKIRYSDCDPQGIVFNANFARYWDDAGTDLMDDAGIGGPGAGGYGVEPVVARLEMDFKSSATLGDILETTIEVQSMGKASMDLGVKTILVGEGRTVVEGRLVWVFVDSDTFRPVPIPNAIREILQGASSAI